MSEDTNLPEELGKILQLAVRPEVGEKFTIAGREFIRSLLRIDADDDMIELLADLAKDVSGKDLRGLFSASLPALRQAATIILADISDSDRDEIADWIANTRGVTNADLMDLVVAQVSLQNAGVLLGKLFLASGLFHALTGNASPRLPT